MSDARILHKKAGTSAKVSALNDFEYRVWTQYLLSADDYGVMPRSPFVLMGDNARLRTVAISAIESAIATTIQSGLLHQFEHQALVFVWSYNWQDEQKIKYPRQTVHPAPLADLLHATAKTLKFFRKHHPMLKKAFAKRLENVSPIVSQPGGTYPPLTQTPTQTLPLTPTPTETRTPTQTPADPAWRPPSSRPNGLFDGASQRRHSGHAVCFPERGLCVTPWVHEELVGKRGGDPQEADAWLRVMYAGEIRELGDRPVGDKADDFWRNRFAARVGTVSANPVHSQGKGARAVHALDQAHEAIQARKERA